jgi:hypothetical protein
MTRTGLSFVDPVTAKGNNKDKGNNNGKGNRRSFDSLWSLRMTAACLVGRRNSRFPGGMTERKARAKEKARARARAGAKAKSRFND